MNKKVFRTGMMIAMLVVLLGAVVPAFAYANSVTYSGQGLIADGFGGYDLQTELCGVANGAEVDGPYLLWVLTATGASNANISFFGGAPVPMTKFGNGTFKYVSPWYSPSTLPGNVVATYDGKAKNAQLTSSHGCRPFKQGAWCSPGFWGNALPGAWNLIGVDKTTANFGGTVAVDANFVATDVARVTTISPDLLSTILTTIGGYYKGTDAGTFYGWGANPFNLTGAWLTNQIPGYTFDPALVQGNESDTCPIDHFGHFK